jgi:hypothetical protein
MKIKTYLIFLVGTGLFLLSAFSFSRGQCPEQPNDSGICDTLHLEVAPYDVFFTGPGHLARVLLQITRDNPGPADSIAGMVFPLCFTRSNPAKYCSLSTYWNNSTNFNNSRSIFRHFITGEDTIRNWMMDLYQRGNGEEWNLINLNLDVTSHFWLAMIPFGIEDPKFGSASRTLLATLTFKVEDTMTVCLDSCFWPPSSRLKLIRWDALAYVPRNNLPYCFTVRPWNAPRILHTSPAKNQLNVSRSSDVSVTYDTTMNGATINQSSFIVFTRSTGKCAGTITYDSLTKTATFQPSGDFLAGDIVTAVLTADILAWDGTPVKKSYSWSFTVAADYGGGNFALQSTIPVGDEPQSIFAADLDKDGDVDLVVANASSDDVSVLLNGGKGVFSPDSVYPTGNQPWSIIAADLDDDGYLDLVTANSNSDNVSILLNRGDGTFAPPIDYAVGSQPHCVVAADFNGDGKLDLAIANAGSGNVSVLLNQGNAVFGSSATFPVVDYPTSLCAADVDKDGDFDIITACDLTDQIAVLSNNGDGTFAPCLLYPAGIGPYSVVAADLDGNGALDLVVGHGSPVPSKNVSVLLNNGNGTFSSPSFYSAENSPLSVWAADLDADGDLDIATGNSGDDNLSFLFNQGGGAFGNRSDFPAGDYPSALFSADLDGNGSMDLITANRGSDDLMILLNFLRGDINGDAVVNVGDMVYLLNYLYKNGLPPYPLPVADVNCDGAENVGDVIFLINYLFKGGMLPHC